MNEISDDFGRRSPPWAFNGMNYALQVSGNGPVKIGYTSNHATTRMSQLQASSPYLLEVMAYWPATPPHEAAIHEDLAPFRVRHEWYHPVAPVWQRIIEEYAASLSREPERAEYLGKYAERYGFKANSFIHEKLRPDLSEIFISPPPSKTEAA